MLPPPPPPHRHRRHRHRTAPTAAAAAGRTAATAAAGNVLGDIAAMISAEEPPDCRHVTIIARVAIAAGDQSQPVIPDYQRLRYRTIPRRPLHLRPGRRARASGSGRSRRCPCRSRGRHGDRSAQHGDARYDRRAGECGRCAGVQPDRRLRDGRRARRCGWRADVSGGRRGRRRGARARGAGGELQVDHSRRSARKRCKAEARHQHADVHPVGRGARILSPGA